MSQKIKKLLQSQEKVIQKVTQPKVFQLPLQQYNFANNTKWIFNIPLGYLMAWNNGHLKQNSQFLQFPINCQSITFPQFKIGTTKTSFLNYGFDISTGQNVSDKTLNITFLVSNNWLQYLLLLKWFNLQDYTKYTEQSNSDTSWNSAINEYTKTTNPYDSSQGPKFPASLYLMDNYNHILVTFKFQYCWLTSLKNIDLSYTSTSETEITSSFELKYYKMNIDINNDILLEKFGNINSL